MLYVTTRSKSESYTAHHTLFTDRASDGGLFLPFRMPVLDAAAIKALKMNSFSENVAKVLQLFFNTNISAWDIECAIGKTPARILSMPHRVHFAKLWNTPQSDYRCLCHKIYNALCGKPMGDKITDWADIAIRIAFMFGICGLLQANGIESFDVVVNSGDFKEPMAVWYARKMGLSVGTVICVCNENSAAWDFLHRGELNTGASLIQTTTPDLDAALPFGLERLIFETLGYDENRRFLEVAEKRRLYQIRPDMARQLSDGMFVSVVGNDRVESVINSVYRSNGCILDPYTAVSYGGMQDYRAKTGESSPTVLLWEYNPISFCAVEQKATGLTSHEIEKNLNQI